jgi:aspartate 1-decarboxylase
VFRVMCRAKIHRATITDANLQYEGSLTLDESLMEAAGLLSYEQVQVVNINTGSRLETYIIPGQADSGIVCLNGAAARLGAVGDKVIIIGYGLCTEEEAKALEPRFVHVDDSNRPIKNVFSFA